MTHEWYSRYDSLVQRVCPDYELGLAAIANAIPRQTRNIIELGCGTGNLTAKIAQMIPSARITATDYDLQMLELAREKLKGNLNVKFKSAEFPVTSFSEYSAVVSSLFFHLIGQHNGLELLDMTYKSGARRVLVFDRVKGETKQQENMFFGYFARNILGLNLPQETEHELLLESANNNPLRLSKHRGVCEDNGFRFEILHQNPNHGFVAYAGTKKR